jgi:pimeloyl-ACP methyl ester carboxylesterase
MQNAKQEKTETITPTFDMVEVEPGRHIHYLLEGPEDAPFVLFDAGAFGIYADGWWVKEVLKHDFRICLYDRAGMGASDTASGAVLSPEFHVEDIRRLRKALGFEEPFILVGHSMAGFRLHAYANLYPEELKGLIFVDALAPWQLLEEPSRFIGNQFGWVMKAGAFGAGKGFAEPVSKITPNRFKLDGEIRADKVKSYASARHYEAARDEVLGIDFEADYLHKGNIAQLPTAGFGSTLLNGYRKEDMLRSRINAGYGYYEKRPWDDHVQPLMGEGAEHIAKCAKDISALPAVT